MQLDRAHWASAVSLVEARLMRNRGHILLAERDPDYAFLVQHALNEAGVTNPVHVVRSRAETLAYLKGEGTYADRSTYPLPTVIVLALKMPLLHDFDVLRWIREQPELSDARVVVLSGIEYEEEARVARELGVDCYQAKPFGFDQLLEMAQHLREWWIWPDDAPEPLERAA